MAKIKAYQTMAIFTATDDFKKKHNIPDHVRQHTIVCTATSMKKANEMAQSLGLGSRVFESNYTYALEHADLIETCEKLGGFVIETRMLSREYTDIREALKKE